MVKLHPLILFGLLLLTLSGTVASGEAATPDNAYGLVFIDSDRDGVWDPGEAGYGGASVTLNNTYTLETASESESCTPQDLAVDGEINPNPVRPCVGTWGMPGTSSNVSWIVWLRIPEGYMLTSDNPQTFISGTDADPVDFGIVTVNGKADALEQPVVTESTEAAAPSEPTLASSGDGVWAAPTAALERIEDTDPAPPLSIIVNSTRLLNDRNIQISGLVRNDGEQTYAGAGVIATLYTAEMTFPSISLGAACRVLEPGEVCPFVLQSNYARAYISYLLHPEGTPLLGTPATIEANVNNVTDSGSEVLLAGTVTNSNPFPVKYVRVGGMLLDATGTIVSATGIPIPGILAPGDSASFELTLAAHPYASYQLFPEAIQE